MTRSTVLALLISVGMLSLAVVAQDAPKVIDVEQLEDNLFVLRGDGSGGNTAVFITTDGVVVVDSKNPDWGQSILDQIRELTSKPVTTLINTHSHHDHVSGNHPKESAYSHKRTFSTDHLFEFRLLWLNLNP